MFACAALIVIEESEYHHLTVDIRIKYWRLPSKLYIELYEPYR